MPDDTNDLRETLAHLHQQLRSSPDVSAGTRAQLQAILQDIHALLAAANSPQSSGASQTATGVAAPAGRSQESLVGRLASAEREFEATHPNLASLVGSVIDALGKMGI